MMIAQHIPSMYKISCVIDRWLNYGILIGFGCCYFFATENSSCFLWLSWSSMSKSKILTHAEDKAVKYRSIWCFNQFIFGFNGSTSSNLIVIIDKLFIRLLNRKKKNRKIGGNTNIFKTLICKHLCFCKLRCLLLDLITA